MPDVLGPRELVEFSFVSKAAPALPTSALLRLARQAWSFNLKMGLTGSLRLTGDTFSYEIEGPCDVIQPLAARILGDQRHGTIRISAFRRLSARRHAGWSTSGFDLGMEPANLASVAEPALCNVSFLHARRARPDAAVLSANVGGGLA